MKKLTILFFLFGSIFSLNAQKLEWVHVYTDSDDLSATQGITTDVAGNVYQTGFFRGTHDFDPSGSTDSHTSAGLNDIFVQKMDASGNHLWVVALGSTGYDQGYDIEVDASGNVYVTGSFTGTVDFNPSAGTQNKISTGGTDVFVLKLNSSGVFQWVYTGGGTGTDESNAIVLDSNGWPYIVGETNGGNFNPSVPAQTIGTGGGRDAFYIKLNSSGTFQWGYSAGSTGDDEAFDVTINAANQLLIAGTFEGTVDFDPSISTTRNRTSNGNKDAFVLWVNSSGNDLGVYAFGGTERETANGIGVDSEGSIYVCGTFDETVDFDAGAGTASESIGDTNDDFYILKLQSNLTFDWVETQTQLVTTFYSNNLSVNASDQIFFGGAMTPVSKGFLDIYDKDGNQLLDGIDIYPSLTNTVHADDNQYFVGGITSGGIHFDACEFGAYVNSSSKAFIAKYDFEQEADLPTFTNSSPSTFSGESITLTLATGDLNGATDWQWYTGSCGGTMAGTGTSISVSPTVETTYYVRGEGYTCIADGSCASVTVSINSPEITYSGDGFTEDVENFGGVEGQLEISIAGEEFTNQGVTLTLNTDYSVSNIPSGLSPSLAVAADGLSAILTLSGESADHQDVDDVSDIQFTFENSAFTGGDASAVINSTAASSNIGVDFNDNNPSIEYGYFFNLLNGATLSESVSIAEEELNASGLSFSDDGMKAFISGFSGNIY